MYNARTHTQSGPDPQEDEDEELDVALEKELKLDHPLTPHNLKTPHPQGRSLNNLSQNGLSQNGLSQNDFMTNLTPSNLSFNVVYVLYM